MSIKKWISQYTDKYDPFTEEEILNCKHLELRDMRIEEIDFSLNNFRGKLIDLSDNRIKKIPKGFVQTADLNLDRNNIEILPAHFKQTAMLSLQHNKIETIEKGFIQRDDLFLNNNFLKELPNNFQQEGKLALSKNLLESLPKNFVQNGSLYLSHNSISSISDNFILDGISTFRMFRNPLEHIPEHLLKDYDFIEAIDLKAYKVNNFFKNCK